MNEGTLHRSNPIRTHVTRIACALALAAIASWSGLAGHASAQEAKPEEAEKVTDANIAAIVLAANSIDIKNGELALTKTKNKEVKAFAQQMITDHTSVNGKATALAGKLTLTPVENKASRDLVTSTDATRKSMRKLSGVAFDRAYVDNEVAYHQAVIDLLDGTIVPAVENQELKDLLVAVRPAFIAHLDHAKMIQASLNPSTPKQ